MSNLISNIIYENGTSLWASFESQSPALKAAVTIGLVGCITAIALRKYFSSAERPHYPMPLTERVSLSTTSSIPSTTLTPYLSSNSPSKASDVVNPKSLQNRQTKISDDLSDNLHTLNQSADDENGICTGACDVIEDLFKADKNVVNKKFGIKQELLFNSF